ncbi:Uu.00g093410.m01.CDS01 [Anthostomella pinea]|uniref:Uu.00g093410.m01.CDS01 n=1 Tax=Anthostomella pinea TaxID=933095 RepID=A0AAI8VPN0_9PEZI|nr:Uu.00g093410.m01.CDS01 [Anthostomella pinea]
MTSSKSADGGDPTGPTTPHRVIAVKKRTPNAAATTDTQDRTVSAPDGDANPNAGLAATRRRATTMKGQPTLLGDFLLGRQSPARVAAEKQAAREAARQRRNSLELVKQEMRQAAVQQVQAPGGVKDRVSKWQKANAEAMATADPLATPTEPSEVNIQVEEDSVTEEDRVRIKLRQKRRPPIVVVEHNSAGAETGQENQGESQSSNPPKKRVVSDTNWVKNQRKKSPPRKRSPKPKQQEGAGQPLPKDFLKRPVANPPVSRKIKDWATKVELPDEPPKRTRASRSVGSGDGIRVKSVPSESEATSRRSESTHITVESTASQRSKEPDGDGIRVKPLRTKKYYDDGIRIRPQTRSIPDDGIRVRPGRPSSEGASTVRAHSPQKSRTPSTRATSTRRDASPSGRIEVIEDPESDEPKTPTQISSKKSSKVRRRPAKSYAETGTTATGTTVTEDVSDSESWSSGSGVESDLPSTVLPKSLADIPVGYSAFSELDLPLGSRGRPTQRPKTTRQSSFKGATNVLKKALTEGKKILTEKAEHHPKPAQTQNRPPNIENWLKDTVDPFVEGQDKTETNSVAETETKAEPPRKSIEKDWAGESNAQHSGSSSRRKSAEPASSIDKGAEHARAKETERQSIDEPSKEEPTTPTSSGLKRSRATRVTSSPLKSTSKRGFKDKLRDAFRGESTGHKPPPLEYSSYVEVVDDEESYDGYQEPRYSSGTRKSPPPADYDDGSSVSAEPAKTMQPSHYPKRRPPTNGLHELSTIVSDAETLSTLESDLSSIVSQTTVTQSTGLTRSTAISRKRSNKSGLKRRLTKHSDLVSVLSLPDDTASPSRSRSLRSARSVRRTSNHLDNASVESLLQEFADDEFLYTRELKTLVDGVIPVLLSQFVHGASSSQRDPFASSTSSQKEDVMSKAVVSMGIALEKLKNHHRRCPISDMHRLPQWLETVQPVYENYLDVWRLGFQGVIVNLAPASPDDEDSLVNAMPRNEQGDVLNEDGDRIDVAHLLKRPLVRVKWITKFVKGYRSVTGTNQYEPLASKWEALQEKARRRNKEENARVTDDDAKNTDTSRVRDLKTMAARDNVRIDRFRQVYAKDSFSLDLRHSNGQRLECQVELVYRDNQLFKSDPGDLLIRETGSEGRSWLLFASITGAHLSARKGDDSFQLVVMIRGYKDEWFELVTLTADDEEQVLDWLDILGSNPVPPAVKDAQLPEQESVVLSPKSTVGDMPLGERKLRDPAASPKASKGVDSPEARSNTPTRYHQRNGSLPTTPTNATFAGASTPSPERTPTQDSYQKSGRPLPEPSNDKEYGRRSRPLKEGMRPDPLTLSRSSDDTTHRDDGPPTPPAHRTPKAKKSPTTLSPPVDTHSSIKRRTSSPLKHEYYPSDASSASSYSTSGSEDDDSYSDSSSDDELEAADMPDTAPAISIRKEPAAFTESVVSESLVSISPSASISQAAVKKPEYLFKSLATISYWDNKHGCWKELWPDICSIVTTPGLIEAHPFRRTHTSSGGPSQEEDRPLIAMDLTPLVMLRNSTALDLEIRSPVLRYARLYSKVNRLESSFFRFRAASFQECENLYMAVHRARLDNAKYKALEEETRIRAFGQHQVPETEGDGNSQRRSWFGRKNSYRASARAPSQSAGSASHSSVSASSFLKKLMGGGGQSFNIAGSSVNRLSPLGSRETSLYTSSSGSGTPPRSPSVSAANSGNAARMSLTTNNLKIRLHLLVSASKWEDHGNCYLEVTRPDQGTKQNLRKYQGMEKRVVVTKIPKKDKGDAGGDKGVLVLDVVLGSRCFSRLGSRGVLLNVWEEVKDESGEAGVAPKSGGSSGNVSKWCFACASVTEASWVFGLVTQEVVIG